MGRFTVIPQDTFEGLQLDAGVLLRTFNPETGAAPKDEDIICATTGGINPSCVPTYSDFAEDVDNAPTNLMEFKHLDGWECKMGFTSLGTSAESIRLALGAADIDPATGKITPPAQREAYRLLRRVVGWRPGGRRNGGHPADQRPVHRRVLPPDHQERQGTGVHGTDRSRLHQGPRHHAYGILQRWAGFRRRGGTLMKLSELSTDKALDALCELTPYIDNIANDAEVVSTIGKVVKPDTELNRYGSSMLVMGRLSEFIPLLLKNHRDDLYGILSILNEKSKQEIAAQTVKETVGQLREAFQDEDLITFFKPSARQAQTEQSAPSAPSHDSE